MTIDHDRLRDLTLTRWDEALPTLLAYMAIPCVSPAYAPDWAVEGHITAATQLMASWAEARLAAIPGASVEVLEAAGRTPLLFIDVPAANSNADPVVLYGHLDKQPAMTGWTNSRSAWSPSVEGDRIYGRGGADDGYAIFAAITAIELMADQELDRPRCLIIIEASEESGSGDLPHYVNLLAPHLGSPSLVVALDAMCATYDRLWVTTSLRGMIAGTLTVRTLTEEMHSGDVSGIVPSSFRLATGIVARIEDPATGAISDPGFNVAVPERRLREAEAVAGWLGKGVYDQIYFADGVSPARRGPADLLIERTWKPQLAVTGLDGLPSVSEASAVMRPFTSLKLSLRLPPTLDPAPAATRLKEMLEADPPNGAQVSFDVEMVSPGWHAPEPAGWMSDCIEQGSHCAFGKPPAMFGGGGGIPFLRMLGDLFPQAQFLVTGVLGPQSNAHGPNEFLHLPTARNVTVALALVLSRAADPHAADAAAKHR